MSKVLAKSYSLRKESGTFLGQVVLTTDGMFASVTDYGNLSYAWRSYGKGDFREFIIGLDIDYFSSKMFSGINHFTSGDWQETKYQCVLFAEKILPPLQKLLKAELESEKLEVKNDN